MFVFDNYYTPSELAHLTISLVLTKLFYPGATLIRRPFIMRGRPRFSYGKGFTTGRACRLETFGRKQDLKKKLVLGENVHIGDYVHIAAADEITLGDNCLLASHVFISDLDHGDYSDAADCTRPDSDPSCRPLHTAPVHIGSNVWIGEGVCILKGVTIGDGCVIGARSIVTKDLPEGSIAVGAPARVVKSFDPESGTWNRSN